MLQINNFIKRYSTGFRLEINSLHLKEGIHLIKGENGAGKSTLFKAIAGIHAFEGEIVLDNISIKQHPVAYRKHVNYSEAEPQFPDFLSLDDLILFVARAKQSPDDQVQSLKEEFGVNNYSKNRISSYSSGMLKKASLLLAFLGSPKLIILDEPFTTIDTETQANLISLIKKELLKGVSFLISSHHLPEIPFFDYESTLQLKNGNIILSK
ncbi:ABC transporter ATP-binding protein [Marivirga sp. S37H4]|uniref:ABC transporter ATP-binding protein n=1 Tax=Marivirga aurantiaca TaxID=2802615 RepID=A0A934X2Q4_9BACT|nr:ABC transporter ATP-binding protein [Marivirga aurantiaca]MBK6267285.1 ABC transporter ATP-binding protein [Marivirga aurantiaca]